MPSNGHLMVSQRCNCQFPYQWTCHKEKFLLLRETAARNPPLRLPPENRGTVLLIKTHFYAHSLTIESIGRKESSGKDQRNQLISSIKMIMSGQGWAAAIHRHSPVPNRKSTKTMIMIGKIELAVHPLGGLMNIDGGCCDSSRLPSTQWTARGDRHYHTFCTIFSLARQAGQS